MRYADIIQLPCYDVIIEQSRSILFFFGFNYTVDTVDNVVAAWGAM